jgi:diguanylate cyclase (GGDEF)-like protein
MNTAIARAAALLCLLTVGAVVLWPPLTGLALPSWARLPAPAGFLLLLMALALALTTTRALLPARRCAIALTVLGAVALLSWIMTAAMGAPASAESLLARWLALRPTLLMSLGITALGGSLCWRHGEDERFDLSMWLGTFAVCLFFLAVVGHLYGAGALTAGAPAAASSGLNAALWFALSLASLTLHANGPFSAYAGSGPGAVAKRRLLPAAVLTPIASGFVLLYALTGQQLSPTLAVALTVFANILVMLLLIDRAGNKVARVAQDRQQRVEAREARVRQQGLRDPMTALLNRRGWDAEVQAGEKRCRAEMLDACVVVIDLDGLKLVNDSEGHKAGDAYIHRAAHALRKAARRGDPLARLGGDEFACLVVGCDEAMARAVVVRFQEALRLGKVGASVGYAMRGRRTLLEAFEQADQAMYAQKRVRKLRRA